jgi:hypothetical protein
MLEIIPSSVPGSLPHSDPLLEELRQVHDMLRFDLATCRRLASAAVDGTPDSVVRDGLERLQTRSLLFQLRLNCLSYCQLVHAHHGREDVGLFPAVRRSAPHLGSAVDRLEADHRAVSMLLDEVETSADDLAHDGAEAARARLSSALLLLSDHLLEHLEYEEETLAPVLRTWDGWPTS